MFTLDGVAINGQFTGANGVRYPVNWLELSTPEQRAALGIVETPDPVREVVATGSDVPLEVSMFQARAALIEAGLFDVVDAHCKAAGGVVLQAWEYANVVPRYGVLVNAIATTELNLADSVIDDLFRRADQWTI